MLFDLKLEICNYKHRGIGKGFDFLFLIYNYFHSETPAAPPCGEQNTALY